MYKFNDLGSSHMIPKWQSESFLPDPQTQKPGGHFAWLKSGKQGRGVGGTSSWCQIWKVKKKKSVNEVLRFQCQGGDGVWSLGARRLKVVVFAKWYSWKAAENRVALDRSNDDPAGRAEQLKKSPGERWELLTATEGLYSAALLRPGADENIAGNTKKH